MAQVNFNEAEHYLAELAPEPGITETIWKISLESAMTAAQLVGQSELISMKQEARARIALRDEQDWHAVTAALLLACPIWTEDQDFFGAGAATRTTATVEIYLKAP